MLSDFRMSALCFAASTSEQKKMLKSTSSKRQDVFLELNALAFDHKRDGPDGGKAVGQWVTAPFNLQMTAKSSHVSACDSE